MPCGPGILVIPESAAKSREAVSRTPATLPKLRRLRTISRWDSTSLFSPKAGGALVDCIMSCLSDSDSDTALRRPVRPCERDRQDIYLRCNIPPQEGAPAGHLLSPLTLQAGLTCQPRPGTPAAAPQTRLSAPPAGASDLSQTSASAVVPGAMR